MRKFEIGELSSVDRPAQQYALSAIMKRAEPQEMDMKFTSYETFDEAIAAVAKATGMPRHAAMSVAAQRWPRLVEKYNAEGSDIAKAAAPVPREPVRAEVAFSERVDAIQKRDCCGRAFAMQRARSEHPGDFAALQES